MSLWRLLFLFWTLIASTALISCSSSTKEGIQKHPVLLTERLFKECKELRELALPSDITRLDWLHGESLTTLSAPGAVSLRKMPSSLRELDIRDTEIESLQFIPRRLRSIDIRGTNIQDLRKLPSRLEILKISGPEVRNLKFLSPFLEQLYLEDIEIKDFSELPRGLKELHLTGLSFDTLNGLPPSLRALTLHRTRGRSLQGLPSSLQELTLLRNDIRFEADALPDRLTELTIDQPLGPTDLSRLKHLEWLSDLREKPAEKLPPSLSSLTLKIRENQFSEFPQLPPSLRALGLIGANFDPTNSLPPSLEKLSLTNYNGPKLVRLPVRLTILSLTSTSISKLPELPEHLEELHLVDTGSVNLSNLPRGLKVLVICATPMDKAEKLKELFPKLERLDLCNSSALKEVGPLPETLTALNISQTGVSQIPTKNAENTGLEELNISRTNIQLSSLKTLPRTLETLILSKGQISSWEDFPPHLQVLRLEESAKTGGQP